MAVVYKKSPLAEALDRIPGYISEVQRFQIERERETKILDARFEQEEKLLQMRLDAQDAQFTKSELLTRYNQKIDEREKAESSFDDYANLSPKDIAGAPNLTETFIKNGKIQEDIILEDIKKLSAYISTLDKGHQKIDQEVAKFTTMAPAYAGLNTILQPFEFQQYKADALSEEGLTDMDRVVRGAAMDYAYGKEGTRDEIQFRNIKMTDYYKKDFDTGAKGSYAVIQGAFAVAEGQDMNDVRARLASATGKEPGDKVLTRAAQLVTQHDYQDFMKSVLTYPKEQGGDELREFFRTTPILKDNFKNLKSDYESVTAIHLEGLGETPPTFNDKFSDFKSDISGVTDTKKIFKLYQDAVSGVDIQQHGLFFEEMESQLGSEDLYPEYTDWLQTVTPGLGSKGLSDLADLQNKFNALDVIAKAKREDYKNYNYHLNAFSSKWGTHGKTQINDIGEAIASTIGVDPLMYPEHYNTSELPDFTLEGMDQVRNVVRSTMTEWGEIEKPRGLAGMYDSLFRSTMDRKDALRLLADYTKFEQAWSDYMGSKDIPVDTSAALLSLQKLLK